MRARDWSGYVEDEWQSSPVPPPDDASLEALRVYWTARDRREAGTRPSVAVQQRLLEHIEKKPRDIASLLDLIGDHPTAPERVKALLDAGKVREDRRAQVRRWLMARGPWFQDELIEEARASRVWGSGDGAWALEALLRLDRRQGMALLAELDGHADILVRMAALIVRHRMARAESDNASLDRTRNALLAIARDKGAAEAARDEAILEVFAEPWPGDAAAFKDLLADPTFVTPHRSFTPLGRVTRNAPERWVPVAISVLGSADRTQHDHAVTCLAQFAVGGSSYPAALAALAPWVADPGWSSAPHRDEVVRQSEDAAVDPAVMEKLLASSDQADLRKAGWYFVEQPDPKVVPLLRQAFARPIGEWERGVMVRAIVAAGGLDSDEALRGLEAWARHVPDPRSEGPLAREPKPYPLDVSLGHALEECESVPDEIVRHVIARADALEASSPQVARKLREIAVDWHSPLVGAWAVERLRAGITPSMAQSMLGENNMRLWPLRWVMAPREDLPREALQKLSGARGAAAGIAAVAARDDFAASQVLSRSADDPVAARTLLAAARYARFEVPVEGVWRLLAHRDDAVVRAAESYLEMLDTPVARALLRARHPGEFLVFGTGGRLRGGEPGFRTLDALEQALRDRLRGQNAPEAIYALVRADRSTVTVAVRAGRGEMTISGDAAIEHHRVLAAAELADLESFLAQRRVGELPPLSINSLGGGDTHRFVALRRDGGFRLEMYGVGHGGTNASVYQDLVDLFEDLATAAPLEARLTSAEIPGARVLLSDPRRTVRNVWASGADVRVLVTNEADDHATLPAWEPLEPSRGTVSAPEGFAAKPRTREDEEIQRIAVTQFLATAASAAVEEVLARVPGGALIERRWTGREEPEYLVVDVATRTVRPVTGEFRPFETWAYCTRSSWYGAELQRRTRPLQPTGRPDEVWATVQGDPAPGAEPDGDVTWLGRYDLRRFVFTPVAKYPGLRLPSETVWVDEPAGLAYAAYCGHLLALPLSGATTDPAGAGAR